MAPCDPLCKRQAIVGFKLIGGLRYPAPCQVAQVFGRAGEVHSNCFALQFTSSARSLSKTAAQVGGPAVASGISLGASESMCIS